MMNRETGVMGQKGGTSEMGQTRPEEKIRTVHRFLPE
jgi:hypothetical protein